jgi:anti-anti-sigma regulatory factor
MTIARRFVSSDPGEEDALVLSLDDRAGLEAATELHTELEGAVVGGSRRVIVELARDAPVDPTMLGVLLAGLRRLQRADAELVLVAADGLRTETAVDALRLDRFFRIATSLPEALAVFGGRSRLRLRTSAIRPRLRVEP